jgi:hypothetical protein
MSDATPYTREDRNLREFVQELADEPCAYGDSCPAFGTRHGRCLACKARLAFTSPAPSEAITQEHVAFLRDLLHSLHAPGDGFARFGMGISPDQAHALAQIIDFIAAQREAI